jgi:hypothetical protein
VLALLLGTAAGWMWTTRRVLALVLAGLCVLAGLAREIETRWIERAPRAVVLTAVPLEGTGLQLEPGQVVVERARRGDQVDIRAASDLTGTVPASALEPVWEGR